MAWIESHIDMGDHPKVSELCFLLMIKKHEAIGHLHLLWHFTMKYAWRDGDLRRFTPRVICHAAGWDKDEATFINALRDSGWFEKDSYQVHDWLEYAGKLVKDRLYNDERRKTASNGVNLRKTSATLPNPTVPNLTKDTTLSPQGGDGASATASLPKPQDVADLWNERAHPNLPRVKEMPETRKKHVVARLHEHPDFDFWDQLLNRINRSRLLTGQAGGQGKDPWRCTFDWIMNPTNLTKIIEGNYDK
jgi:hypothetical protein